MPESERHGCREQCRASAGGAAPRAEEHPAERQFLRQHGDQRIDDEHGQEEPGGRQALDSLVARQGVHDGSDADRERAEGAQRDSGDEAVGQGRGV